MNKKWLPYLIIIVLALAVWLVKKGWDDGNTNVSDSKSSSGVNRDHGFDRRTTFLEYSAHAKCRMQCRKISQAEVEDIMKNGKINYNKSSLKNSRCPRYAVEGTTTDAQKVRIVYAQCNKSTTVVTVIDLGTDWTCDCPGDDDKYKNRN